MAIVALNEDVVAAICDRLTNISDVCAISLTCSSFRPLAVKRLISVRPIHLTAGASIQRFHAFVFADESTRAPLIRALGIETGAQDRLLPPQPGDAALLIHILTSCKHLEHISFRRLMPSSPMLTDDPGVIDAIASLPDLRSLSIESPYSLAATLISKIDTPLRTLDLACFKGGSDMEYSLYPAAFRGSFSRLARTLEELNTRLFFVDPDAIHNQQQRALGRPAPPLSAWQQYPAVRSLSVESLVWRPLLEPLQHLFPALDRTLSVGTVDLYNPETFPDLRTINLHAQGVNLSKQSGGRRPARGWTKLDRVDCSSATFYVLALRCPIRLAVINGIYAGLAPELGRDWLAESLRENPVPRLSLGLRLDSELEGLRGLFGPEMGGTLTHLTLALETGTHWPSAPQELNYGWGKLLEEVLSLLAPLRTLTHLRLVFHSDSTEDASVETLTPEQELQRAVHPSAFDFSGNAAALARPLAALRFLSLTTCGRLKRVFPRWYRDEVLGECVSTEDASSEAWAVSRAWSVSLAECNTGRGQTGPSREPTLVGLQDVEAEEIIRREELVLPNKSYEKP